MEAKNKLDVPKNDYFYSEEQLKAMGFMKENNTIAFAVFFRKEDGCEIVFKKCGNIHMDTCDSYLIVSIDYKKELKKPEIEGSYSMEELMKMGFVVEKECTVYTFFIRQQDGCSVVCKNPAGNDGYSVRCIEFR